MKKERVGYYDVLNIGAALSVIFLHCNGMAHTYSNTLAWKQALFIEVICYWAVPVFFMLSGATLFQYRDRYTTKEFFIKRITRTVFPYMGWLVINMFIKRINPFDNGIKGFISDILNASYEGIYWFFFPLFAIYLCIPIMSTLIEKKAILRYMCLIGFVFNSFLPEISKELGIMWNGNLSAVMLGGYMLYPILGYLLATTELDKKKRVLIYGLGVFGATLRYIRTYQLSTIDGTINKMYFSYLGYYAVLLSVAVFVFVKNSKIVDKILKSRHGGKVLSSLSSMSFGVYLVHMIVYRFLAKYISTGTWKRRLLVPFIIYGICIGIILVMKKIPVIKRIVP